MHTDLLSGRSGFEYMQKFALPYGAATVAAGAFGGKTLLAEVLATYIHDMREEHAAWSPSDACTPEVVSAALTSWMSASFFMAVQAADLFEADDLRTWAKELLKDAGLCTLSDVSAMVGLVGARAEWDTLMFSLERLFAKRDSDASTDGFITARITDTVYSTYIVRDDDSIVVYLPVKGPTGKAQGLYLACSLVGSTRTMHLTKKIPATVEILSPDDVDDLREALGALTATKLGKDGFKCLIPLRTVIVEDDVVNHPTLVQNTGDLDLFLTSHGVQFRLFDLTNGNDGDVTLDDEMWDAFAQNISTRVRAERPNFKQVRDDSIAELAEFFDSLFENDALTLLTVLAQTGVLRIYVASSGAAADRVGRRLGDLYQQLEPVNAPVIIMTEAKANTAYSASATNMSLEEKATRLTLKLQDGTELQYESVCSLLGAALGSFLLNGVTHISTLDLTMVRDLEVKTATQKGGLDSAILNIMQFLSNAAIRAHSNVVIETRDDFTEGDGASTGGGFSERSKKTMGANSRLAIVIADADEADTTRDFWFRFKGGDVYDDIIREVSMVSKDDYGRNMFRPANETRPLPGDMTEGEIYAHM